MDPEVPEKVIRVMQVEASLPYTLWDLVWLPQMHSNSSEADFGDVQGPYEWQKAERGSKHSAEAAGRAGDSQAYRQIPSDILPHLF